MATAARGTRRTPAESLEHFAERSSPAARVEAAGGRVSAAVSASTDYVVAGAAPGETLEAARKRGVRVLDEKEFLGLMRAAR